MNENHIIELLENGSVLGLTAEQLTIVRRHIAECESCNSCFEVAHLTGIVIKEHCRETFEPSPFFHTRVLAALREQQDVNSVPAFLRLWRSASAVVASMAVTTAALAVLAFVLPTNNTPATEATAVNAYSAESVLLGADEEVGYEQVLSTIYGPEDETR